MYLQLKDFFQSVTQGYWKRKSEYLVYQVGVAKEHLQLL